MTRVGTRPRELPSRPGMPERQSNHGGDAKTLDEMFDPQHQGITGKTLAALARIGMNVTPSLAQGKVTRSEPKETRECAEIGLAWAAAICEENGQEFAGYTSVTRSHYDIKGRPDEELRTRGTPHRTGS